MDPMKFLDILDSSLTEAELNALCRQFSVAFGAFPGMTKREKAREFLGYIQRKGRMASLAEAMTALRPDLSPDVARLFEGKEKELDWIDELAADGGRGAESGLTWRWPSSTPMAQVVPEKSAAAGSPPPMVDAPNPYTPGQMVIDEAMFFGREAEREQLHQQLSRGEHMAITGGRGLGGSSLLYHAARRFDDSPQLLSAYVDLKDPAHQTVSGLLDSAWRQWWERVRPGNAVHVRTLPDFVTAVRKLNDAGYRPLLFLDELEQLVWRPSTFDDELFNAWRELGDGRLGFVLSSHTSVADLLAQNGFTSGFYELFQPLNLGLLDDTAARDMLAVPLRRAGIEAPDGAVDYFVDKAGPHPFFLQIAGHYLFDSLARRSYSRSEVHKLFVTAAEPFWQELWYSMTPLAQEFYPTSVSSMTEGMAGRQLRIIANKGLAVVDEEGIRPFSAGFADWLGRMRAAVEAAAAVARA